MERESHCILNDATMASCGVLRSIVGVKDEKAGKEGGLSMIEWYHGCEDVH